MNINNGKNNRKNISEARRLYRFSVVRYYMIAHWGHFKFEYEGGKRLVNEIVDRSFEWELNEEQTVRLALSGEMCAT